MGLNKGHKNDKECEQAKAHQVCVGHDPRGVWLHPIWAVWHGVLKISKGKGALKFIKKTVETHIRAKRKEKLSNVLAAMGKVAAKKEPLPPLYIISLSGKKK